jgi:membrane protein
MQRVIGVCSNDDDFMRNIWPLLTQTVANWSNHKTSRLGAALAYYSIFSIGPIILISIAVAGFFFGHEAVHGEVSVQIRGLLGSTGADMIEAMLAGARQPHEGLLATLFGLAVLLFAAVGVVAQLKDALNTVWDVDTARTGGTWAFVRSYMVSLAGVLALGFLLLVSLIFTTALAAAGKYLATYIPEASLQILGSVISFLIVATLFAMLFKWLPDAPVAWRDVWLGAMLTALLFEIGKLLIGLYVGKQGLQSTFGAAASLVVVLIWVYYSSQIVLLGAEFTHVYACRRRLSNAGFATKSDSAHRATRVGDPVRVAMQQSPAAAILLAACTGWVLGRERG